MKEESKVSKPKYWKELTVDEKIERMREQVKRKDDAIIGLRGQIHRLENQLEKHSHSNGEVVTPIRTDRYFSNTDGKMIELKDKDAVYF